MDNETEIETKVCPQCGEEKALTFDNFYRSKQTKSGFKPWCKPCVNASNKAYDKANPEQHSRRVVVSRNRTEERKQRHRDSVNKHRNRNLIDDSRDAKELSEGGSWLVYLSDGGYTRIMIDPVAEPNKMWLTGNIGHYDWKTVKDKWDSIYTTY